MIVTTLLLAGVLTAGPVHVDLRPAFAQWQMPPRAQGGRGTCSVFTVTGGLEYALACRTGHGVPLSAEYLNWAAHESINQPGDGAFFWMATQGYEKYGICQDALMPYQQAYDAERKPSDEATADARTQLQPPLVFHWIKENGSPRGLSDDEVAQIKEALRAGWPVCAGAGHSVLYVGYHEDPDFPGWRYFITRDSGLGGYGKVSERTAREIVCDAVWVEAPGSQPPVPSAVDPEAAPPTAPEPTLRGDALAPGWSVRVGNGSLHALSFSADGKMLAASWRHPCDSRLYNAANGGFVGTLGGDVMSVAFAPDGQRVAAGACKVARLLSATDGTEQQKLDGHPDWVEAAAWSAQAGWLATGCGDRIVRLWNADGSCRLALKGATGPISQVWVSPDGKHVAASSWDHTLRVWDAQTGDLAKELPGCDAAALLPDSSGLAVGRDGQVELVPLGPDGAKGSLACAGKITALACSPDGRLLAAGNDGGRLRILSVPDGKVLSEVDLGAAVTRLVFSPDGTRLASGTPETRVSVWRVRGR